MSDEVTEELLQVDLSIKDQSQTPYSGYVVVENVHPLTLERESRSSQKMLDNPENRNSSNNTVHSTKEKRGKDSFLEMLVSDYHTDTELDITGASDCATESRTKFPLETFESLPVIELSPTKCQLCFCACEHPLRLACLHIFCERCIREHTRQTYVNKQVPSNQISCPVCFASNLLPSGFTTNSKTLLNQSISEELEENEVCKPKFNEDRHKTSTTRDRTVHTENDKTFCSQCSSYTFQCPAKCRNHRKLIERYDSRHVIKAEHCETHGRVLDFVCLDHSNLICKKCLKKYHHRCSNVASVSETAERLDKDKAMEKLLQILKSGKTAMEVLVDDLNYQKRILSNDKASGLSVIKEMRQDINRRLDTIQTQLENEIDKHNKEEEDRIGLALQQSLPFSESISSCLEICESSKSTDNPLQKVAAYLYGKCEVESCKGFANYLSGRYSTPHINVNIDECVLNIKFIAKFGNTHSNRKHRELPKELRIWPSYTMRKLKEILKLNLRVPDDHRSCDVQGTTFLRDGTIAITDSGNGSLKFFSNMGKYLGSVTFRDPPFDVCEIQLGKVAVSRPYSQTISILEIDIANRLSVITNVERKVGKPCYSITCLNGNLIFSTGPSRPCQVYKSVNDKKLETLNESNFPIYGLTKNAEQKMLIESVFSRHSSDVSVLQVSTRGEKTCLLRNNVAKGARGIGMDIEGNIYVCGYRSSNVIQISSNGECVRQLLSCENGIKNPIALSVYEDLLLVVEECSNKGRLLQLAF